MALAELVPVHLRCEYQEHPLGLEEAAPRLMWQLDSPRRGEVQTAYQVLVASREELLAADVGDLWDSGRVPSGRATAVYQGRPLVSGQRCYWKVRVWDREGRASRFSEPSWWEMGLLSREEWSGHWISFPVLPEDPPLLLDGCPWVWAEDRDAPEVCVRTTLTVPKAVLRARMLVTADARFSLFVNGVECAGGVHWRTVQDVDLTQWLRPGRNTVAVVAVAPAGGGGVLGRLWLRLSGGEEHVLDVDRSWRVSSAPESGGESPDVDDSAWPQAAEVARHGDPPWGLLEIRPPIGPVPFVRRRFSLPGRVRRARVYATALGIYELRLNGEPVGDDRLAPGWTDYRKRVQYQTYDVTHLLHPGENVIGALLADGWYAGHVALFGRCQYGAHPALRVLLRAELEDGSVVQVTTDSGWRGRVGPYLEADLLMGEVYDARRALPGWDRPGYDDSSWEPVTVEEDPGVALEAQRGPTARVTAWMRPVAVTHPAPGVHVYDMGQNMVGSVRLRVRGPAGTAVVLRFGEMLRPDGTLYRTNLRSARQTDVYILRGEGTEEYEPRFTYHGFRYVEVRGPEPVDLVGLVVRAAAPETGEFSCSSPMVNRLHQNILWSQRGNMLTVPTDCPQRDERMGWTGDAQVFLRTATYLMDVAGFFRKWMVDVEDAQGPSGAFPHVAPTVGWFGEGSAAWADAGVIVPWTLYTVYGDVRVVERHYPAMQRWIAYLKEHSPGLLRPAEGYGDWLAVGVDTPKDLIGTAYFAYSTRLLARMARILGKDRDAREYEALFEDIRRAFQEAFVLEDGRVKGETQTGYVLALYMDLLPDHLRPQAARHLVADIERRGHLTTGFVGVAYLLPVLSDAGYDELAYRLLLREEYPSWGHMVRHGATTMWERWNSYDPERGFADAAMNSFNHYALGSVGEWLYRYVAGIDTDPDAVGYERIRIRPHPTAALSHARAVYHSVRGRIVSGWERREGKLRLEVEIPAGTQAVVHVPVAGDGTVTEGGRPAAEAEGVQVLGRQDGTLVLAVGSGRYELESTGSR